LASEKGTGTFIVGVIFKFAYSLPLPRTPRTAVVGECCHLLNRGNGFRLVFHKDADSEAFLKSIALDRIEVPVPGYCPMPNHFRLVVQAATAADPSMWMHRQQNTHI
jgi:putative transposase